MNILQQIFRDHFEEMLYILHPRDVVIENVEKMMFCGDPSFGGALFACPFCDALKFVPFRCKSRFCPSCGNKYAIDRSTSMASKLINCSHRHLVFTIDQDLRPFFLHDRSLLNCLFSAVNSVISRLFFNLNKSKNFVPGFICTLHTFGRPLEWNPHIHCILSEGGFSDDSSWRSVRHFHYALLRKSFQTALLNLLESRIGPSFKKIKASIYRKDINGFYVYAKPNLSNPNSIVKYISRYLGRPVIATSRIDSYDGDFVSFHYNRHEDNRFVRKTLPVLDFIQLLIQHIPEKHFKMTRYYGLYARHRPSDALLHMAIHPSKRRLLLDFNSWRNLILISFGYDPLLCPRCNHHMVFLDLRFRHHPVSLEDLFERTMCKARLHCRSSGRYNFA